MDLDSKVYLSYQFSNSYGESLSKAAVLPLVSQILSESFSFVKRRIFCLLETRENVKAGLQEERSRGRDKLPVPSGRALRDHMTLP